MAKRRLSKNQTRRIRENLDASVKRANTSETTITEDTTLGPETRGRVVAHFGTQVEIECHKTQLRRRCHVRANLEAGTKVVTGDNVVWRDGPDLGVVVSLEPRTSELNRPDPYGKLKPVAANIDQIIVTIAPKPLPHYNLIDRYLVAAEIQEIQPIIVLNKCDLVVDENIPKLQALENIYTSLGYTFLRISAANSINMDALTDHLQNKTSVFVGQSGVGKSSIVQTLLPEETIKVGSLSEADEQGRHTTTNSQLYRLVDNGFCIDSPGIREFGLWYLNKHDVLRGFKEISNAADQCKFRDCAHASEPGCAITKAIKSGEIQSARFKSYQHILSTIDDVAIRGAKG
ncbi:MAG: ribosome biogenesis GTPase RsgA [Alteromonadaceae bacterium]|nr:MAG: ribosome biogenesis GTPase RsgA [Alteromonadaceae bacterium]